MSSVPPANTAFRARASIMYNDQAMFMETHFWVLKRTILQSRSYKLATKSYKLAVGIQKKGRQMYSSLRRMDWRSSPKPAETTESFSEVREPNSLGHNNYAYLDRSSMHGVCKCWRGLGEYEARERYETTKQANYNICPMSKACVQQDAAQSYSHGISLRYNMHRPITKDDTMSAGITSPADVPSPIEDCIERKKFIENKLTSILGPARMEFQLQPSGHSGIDPVIAQHNQNQFRTSLQDRHNAWKAEQRNLAEDRQRQAIQETRERARIAVLLDYHRSQYLQRLEVLVRLGPQLNVGIDRLEVAMANSDMREIAGLVSDMVGQILEPAYKIMQEMSMYIPLEESGAAELQDAWPLARVSQVFLFLSNAQSLPRELIYFGQGIEAVCKYILNPVPFQNPLDYSVPSNNPPTSHVSGGFTVRPLAPFVVGTPPPAPASTPAAAPEATASIPVLKISPPTPTAAPSRTTFDMMNLMHFLVTEDMDLHENVGKLVKPDGNISSQSRSDVSAMLETALEIAQESQGFFAPTDAPSFKVEVDRVIQKLENLAKMKNHTKTVELKATAKKVRRFWRPDV